MDKIPTSAFFQMETWNRKYIDIRQEKAKQQIVAKLHKASSLHRN